MNDTGQTILNKFQFKVPKLISASRDGALSEYKCLNCNGVFEAMNMYEDKVCHDCFDRFYEETGDKKMEIDHENAMKVAKEMQDRRDKKYHEHPFGTWGASRAGRSVYWLAMQCGGAPYPDSETIDPIKTMTGAMDSGTHIHEREQRLQPMYWNNKEIQAKTGIHYAAEVYTHKEGIQIGALKYKSPLDHVWADKPFERIRAPEFDNLDDDGKLIVVMDAYGNVTDDGKAYINILADGATIHKILDTKGAGGFMFSKYTKIYEENREPERGYKAQMHIYMKMNGAPGNPDACSIEMEFISKVHFDHRFTITCHWDQDFFDWMIAKNDRAHGLSKQIQFIQKLSKKLKTLDPADPKFEKTEKWIDDLWFKIDNQWVESDLAWFEYPDDFECRRCWRSQSKQVPGRDALKLQLIRPCDQAVKMQKTIWDRDGFPLQVGTKYKMGRAKPTVTRINWDIETVEYQYANKKQFEESIWFCVKNLKGL